MGEDPDGGREAGGHAGEPVAEPAARLTGERERARPQRSHAAARRRSVRRRRSPCERGRCAGRRDPAASSSAAAAAGAGRWWRDRAGAHRSALRGSPAAGPARSRALRPRCRWRARAGSGGGSAGAPRVWRGARSSRSGRLRSRWLVARDEHLSARPVRGRSRRGRCAAAARAAGGGGQHPRDVRGAGERDLVGLACERAAVDHGQRVALAGVLEQQLDARPREHVGVSRGSGREDAQPVAGGRDQLPGREAARRRARRPRSATAAPRRRRSGRSRRPGRRCRRRAPRRVAAPCRGERDQVGERAGAGAAAQPAHRQQRPAARGRRRGAHRRRAVGGSGRRRGGWRRDDASSRVARDRLVAGPRVVLVRRGAGRCCSRGLRLGGRGGRGCRAWRACAIAAHTLPSWRAISASRIACLGRVGGVRPVLGRADPQRDLAVPAGAVEPQHLRVAALDRLQPLQLGGFAV